MNRLLRLAFEYFGQSLRRSWKSACIVVALMFICRAAMAAPSSKYRFVLIAEGGGTVFSTFGNSPSLNEHGTVAFTTVLTSPSIYAVYTGDGITTTKVIDTSHSIFSGSEFRSIQNNPSINDSGAVAFGAHTGVNGVWTSDGIIPTSIHQPALSIAPSINNAGAVAFNLSVGAGLLGVARGNGGPLSYIADAADNFCCATEPVLNNSGKAVFLGQTNGTVDTAIYVGDGGPLTTIVAKGESIGGGPPIEFFGSMHAINDLDEVVFGAMHSTGLSGIYRAGVGGIETVVNSAGPFAEFFSAYGASPALNNHGDVVFYAKLDGGGNGAFMGPDPVHDRLLGSGDVLFGRTVQEVVFGPAALNDRGQFAMQVLAANGPAFIVRADPIPEPMSLIMMTATVPASIAFRQRSRRQSRL
jgi:hypothetical protein